MTVDGIQTDPDKTILIEEWPIPACTNAVRRFLCIIRYYRKCIPCCEMGRLERERESTLFT